MQMLTVLLMRAVAVVVDAMLMCVLLTCAVAVASLFLTLLELNF